MSVISLSNIKSDLNQPRRKIVTVTVSGSVDIPSWAQGGKGIV